MLKGNWGQNASLASSWLLICLSSRHLSVLINQSANTQNTPDIGRPAEWLFTCNIHDLSQLSRGKTCPFPNVLQPQQSLLIRCSLDSLSAKMEAGFVSSLHSSDSLEGAPGLG